MSTSPTLWVGTNSGLVLVLSLSIPHLLDIRQRDGVTAGNKIIQSSGRNIHPRELINPIVCGGFLWFCQIEKTFET